MQPESRNTLTRREWIQRTGDPAGKAHREAAGLTLSTDVDSPLPYPCRTAPEPRSAGWTVSISIPRRSGTIPTVSSAG